MRREGESVPRPAPGSSVPWRIVLPCFFLLVLAASLHDIWNGDLGFHLSGGRAIVESGGLPQHDLLSYTAEGQPWINFQWFYDLLVYGVWSASGPGGTIALHAFFNLVTFGVLAWYAVRRKVGWPVVLLLFLALLACEVRFTVRPHAVERMFVVGFLCYLFLFRRDDTLPWWPAAILQLAWANMHGSHLVAIPVTAVLVLEQLLERKPWRRPVWLLAGVTLATLVNPYGLKQAYALLRHHRVLSALDTNPEWWPLRLTSTTLVDPAVLSFLVLTVVALACLWNLSKRHRVVAWVLFLGAAVAPFVHARALSLSSLVMAFLAVDALGRPGDETSAEPDRYPLLQRITCTATVVLLLFTTFMMATNRYTTALERTSRFGVGISPVMPGWGAGAYLSQFEKIGNVFNTYRAGGWLSWWLQPIGGRVFIDSRDVGTVYTPADLVRYRQILGDPAVFDYNAERHDWDAVVCTHSDPLAFGLLQRLADDPRWRVCYLDAEAVVFMPTAKIEGARLFMDRHHERWVRSLGGGVLKKFPAVAESPIGSAWSLALSRLNLDDAAATGFEQSLEVQPRDLDALVYLGTVELRRGNQEKAVELLKRVVELEQKNGD